MPLNYSGTEAAVSENIRREKKHGKKQSQAVAIALDIKRRAQSAKAGKKKSKEFKSFG